MGKGVEIGGLLDVVANDRATADDLADAEGTDDLDAVGHVLHRTTDSSVRLEALLPGLYINSSNIQQQR